MYCREDLDEVKQSLSDVETTFATMLAAWNHASTTPVIN